MSLPVSAPPASPKNGEQDTNRRYANFHPSIWGDHFLSYATNSVEAADEKKLQDLREQIKRILKANVNKPAEKLDLVDTIQRLGVSYHFQTDIDKILEKVYEAHQDSGLKDEDDDLYSISLEFRLLRQHGYNISCDVFNKLKDSNDNFKKSLVKDIRGMLSLYEASHLRVHGETILEEALVFTTTHLESMATQLTTPLAAQVKHALNQPLRRGIPRLEARHYMTAYQEEPLQSEVLLHFAKLDYNLLQKLHQKELSEIFKWWKDIDFTNKLQFARDRVVECYLWILGVYFEPEYLLGRKFLTKVIAMITIIDDIYDVHGTVDELELFTSATERWDVSAMDQLPEYMQICYAVLLDIYREMETEMIHQGKLYGLHYVKEAMKTLVRNFFIEAKWCHENYVPNVDEHMSVASVTIGFQMLIITSFVGMGDISTKEAFEWTFRKPHLLEAATKMARLMNDIGSHKFEQKRQHVASSMECFLKKYDVTEEEAYNELRKQITDGWKDVNKELLRPTGLPMPLLVRILNLLRVGDVIYKHEDAYTQASVYLKDYITSLLIDPVPI